MYADAPRRDVQLLLAAGVPHERIQELTGVSVRTIHRIGREPVTAELTAAPAAELATLYHERWELEATYDEIKTHMLGRAPILHSKTPALVRQVTEGLMLAHYAVRHCLYETAHEADEDPDRLSFTHAVQVVRRRIQNPGASPLSSVGEASISPSGTRS